MSSPILTTRELTIGYKSRRTQTVIAEKLNLSLNRGELICLLGPNGAGKSTLMRTLAAMQPALDGEIKLNGSMLAEMKPAEVAKLLSVVLTDKVDTGLLPAYGVVALGRFPYTDWQGRLSVKDEEIVQQAMSAVGAEALANRPVIELSDGERQKVMIARALAQEPQLMILDEPTAYLDLPRRVEIIQILRRLAHHQNRAVLLSTHDLDLALRSADQIWLLNDGNLQHGTPEDLVLNGTFARAFASEGVTFDTMTGSFTLPRTGGTTVSLTGHGPTRVWTMRALEREGYSIVDEAGEIEIRCLPDNWQINYQDETVTANSIAELLTILTTKSGARVKR